MVFTVSFKFMKKYRILCMILVLSYTLLFDAIYNSTNYYHCDAFSVTYTQSNDRINNAIRWKKYHNNNIRDRRGHEASFHPLSIILQSSFSPNVVEDDTSSSSTSNHNDNIIKNSIKNVTTSTTAPKSATTIQCNSCQREFPTRNALFRHLRNDYDCPACANYNNNDINNNEVRSTKKNILFLLGYHYDNSPIIASSSGAEEKKNDDDTGKNNDYEQIGNHVSLAFQQSWNPELTEKNEYDDETDAHFLNNNDDDNVNLNNDPSSPDYKMTQVTVPKLRHSLLYQEPKCHSTGDFLSISTSLSIPQKYATDDIMQQKLLDQAVEITNRRLLLLLQQSSATNNNTNTSEKAATIKILDAKFLELNTFHAEKDCTQRIYHYLFPVRWLPGGDDILKWWIDNYDTPEYKEKQNNNTGQHKSHHYPRAQNPPPNNSIQLLKQALRSAESPSYILSNKKSDKENVVDDKSYDKTLNDDDDENDDDSSNPRMASGRFGLLASKERRCWHNYADPNLKGEASPNNKPIWRVLDRARIIEFVRSPSNNELHLVIEFKGDDFVPQQVRRIIGTSLAMVHQWLPTNFFNISTNPDYFIPTILATPPSLDNHHRMYMAGARFHFHELSNGGKQIFDNNENSLKQKQWVTEMRNHMFHKLSTNSSLIQKKEDEWMDQVRNKLAPQIRSQLQSLNNTLPLSKSEEGEEITNTNSIIPSSARDDDYLECLGLLRNITVSGNWPKTSIARSRVIKNKADYNIDNPKAQKNIISTQQVNQSQNKASSATADDAKSPNDDNERKPIIDSGSFTIINPKFFQQLENENNVIATKTSNIRNPLGNQLFPELVEAVFNLEQALSDQMYQEAVVYDRNNNYHQSSSNSNSTVDRIAAIQRRPASSHCAINRNAQFTPHVDSGRGAGQSLSMIVGLGDYNSNTGGQLMVEGIPHDIRYKPLEFDGWKLRHWTQPFQGERFSLVWFTPEM